MSTDPTAPHHPEGQTHPGWCDPFECTPMPADVEHRSAVDVERFADFRASTTLIWAQEYAYPDEDSTPDLEVDVTSTTMRGQAALVHLRLEEIPRLVAQLQRRYYEAQFRSAPVARRSVTS